MGRTLCWKGRKLQATTPLAPSAPTTHPPRGLCLPCFLCPSSSLSKRLPETSPFSAATTARNKILNLKGCPEVFPNGPYSWVSLAGGRCQVWRLHLRFSHPLEKFVSMFAEAKWIKYALEPNEQMFCTLCAFASPSSSRFLPSR